MNYWLLQSTLANGDAGLCSSCGAVKATKNLPDEARASAPQAS